MNEDRIDRCGWKWLRLFKDSKTEPYHLSCVAHDGATSKGSVKEEISTLEKVQLEFEGDIDREREARYSGIGAYRILGSFYKMVTRGFTWMFWEGK